MRNLFLFIAISICSKSNAQNLQSPEQFLGYQIGTKYTPHYKIVNYFEQVAKNASANVKYINYGYTNEGKPLTLAFVSSSENITNLENIRKANLQRYNLQNNSINADVAIVWLSYNVHGNEPSSSEAAMQSIYELVTKHTSDWLKNTVVIIDPCLNPDGRDRYVNWFNSMKGSEINPNPNSREHQEPWPGGRVNHYYYDLNRDWAWQTQIETKQRIKVYNQWMPNIHVDFHEQGYNEPYYFAPAAEPMHEVITQWQRDFQVTIGKNNAKYFDQNGWYYFTKERFDLFYPSYGDTYPLYNGSIGMTYEQGGHSMGGLAVVIDNGDTLSLVDRVKHHFTSSMSTVEASSQNVPAILNNFSKYFANANNAVGSNYKTYILTSNDFKKLKELGNLLNNNEIKFNYINKISANGYNYFSNKNENINLDKYSISVSAYQPKSLLAKVLLEPTSKLSDTATYDITAWSLPYAYGIKTYASTEKLNADKISEPILQTNIPTTNFALFIPYHTTTDAKLLAELVNKKVKIYINEKEITSNGKEFGKGTIIIPKKENFKNWNLIEEIIKKYNVQSFTVNTGFADKGPDMGSPDIKFIAAPKIFCATNNSVNANASGEVWNFFDNEIQYPITMINAEDINLNALKYCDVLILPDGNYNFLSDKNKADDIKSWVKQGGRLIALEAATAQIANTEWGVKMKKDAEVKEKDKEKDDENAKNTYENLKKYGNKDRDDIVNNIPGAIYEVELDNTHPLAFGYDKIYYTLKQNADFLEFSKNAWNVGVIKKNKKTAGFAGNKILQKIKDGTVLSVQDLGSGEIIYFVDDPMFRSFWQNGKLLFFNASFLVGNNATRL